MPEEQAIKTRGRPKGSKDKSDKRISPKRPNQQPLTKPGENTRFLTHDLKLMHLPSIDMNELPSVSTRVEEYFNICADDDIKPSIASLALAFHVSRFVLFDWINGRNKTITNIDCIHTLKNAYDIINSYYEHLMNNGRINPVSGIFLMKNNLGYKDQTDYVLSSGNNENLSITDISDRAGLLNE